MIPGDMRSSTVYIFHFVSLPLPPTGELIKITVTSFRSNRYLQQAVAKDFSNNWLLVANLRRCKLHETLAVVVSDFQEKIDEPMLQPKEIISWIRPKASSFETNNQRGN